MLNYKSSQSLKDVTWLGKAQWVNFYNFPYICLYSFFHETRLEVLLVTQILQTNVEKILKNWASSSQATPSKLGEYSLLPSILTLQFPNWQKFSLEKKLFAIGFPYQYCHFWLLCLLVEIVSKTVMKPILKSIMNVAKKTPKLKWSMINMRDTYEITTFKEWTMSSVRSSNSVGIHADSWESTKVA